MPDQINEIKIGATITPTLDHKAADKVGDELKNTLQKKVEDLDFSPSATKAVLAIDKAAKSASKTRNLYISNKGRSEPKLTSLKSIEDVLGNMSALGLAGDKAGTLAALKKTRDQLSQMKASKGLPKASLEALASDLDAAITAVQRMRTSTAMLSRKAPMAIPAKGDAAKPLPQPVIEEREAIAGKLMSARASIEAMIKSAGQSEEGAGKLRDALGEIDAVFDTAKPLEEAITNVRKVLEEAAAGHTLGKQAELSRSLMRISTAAKTIDTTGLTRPTPKAAPAPGKDAIVNVAKLLEDLKEQQFILQMKDRWSNADRDANDRLTAQIEALEANDFEKYKTLNATRDKAEANAKAQLQAEHNNKVRRKARKEEIAAERAAEEEKIRAAIAKFKDKDGTERWAAHLGKGMNPLMPRRAGRVVKTDLDALHSRGEALQFNVHRIFRKYDPSYREGAWYTKKKGGAEAAKEAESATAATTEAVGKATEGLSGLDIEFKHLYECVGNLTDTVNGLVNYLINKEATKAVRNNRAKAKAAEDKAKKAEEKAAAQAAKVDKHPEIKNPTRSVLSDTIRLYGKKFGLGGDSGVSVTGKDAPGSEKFKNTVARMQAEANAAPTSLKDRVDKYLTKFWLAMIKSADRFSKSKLGKIASVKSPLLNGLKGFRDDRRKRREKTVERLEARLERKREKERISQLREQLHPNRRQRRSFGDVMSGFGKRFKESLTGGAKGVLRFANTVKRAFRYRVVRNLVNRIIKLIREGFTNLDEYSEHMGTDFHQNVLKLASSLLYLKNAFAAMAAPLVNFVTPVLEKLMDTFAELANHIGAFFAAITGQNKFSAALKKTVTQTKQAAGKLKDILAFDELNRLSGDTNGGVSADEMFEEWGNGTIFQTMFDAVKDAKWRELGELLAKKINGLVKAFDEKEFGKKLGERLGGAISTLSSFFNNLDTVEVGSAIAGWLNRVIGGITWSDLGNLIARKFTIVIDLFAGFIKTLDWTSVANALSDMIVGVFKGFKDWLDKVDWAQAGKDLVKTIADFIKGIKLEDIISAVLELLGSIGKAIGGFIDGLIEEIFGGVPKWLHKLLTGESTTIDLNANVSEAVEAKFDSESKGLFAKILDFLGIGNKGGGETSSETSGWLPLGFAEGYTIMGQIKEWLGKIFGKEESLTTYLGTMKGWGKWLPSGARAKLEGLAKGGLPGVASGVAVSGQSYLQFAAGGGVIDKGQLFIANEAGPELVGTVGGRTTVTNQDQFTQGLIDANEMVVDAVMQVVRAVNNKNFDVYMDAQKVGKSVTTYQNNAARRYGV